MARFLIVVCGLFFASPSRGQVLISTGNNSGARLYYPGSNDWWIDPSQGRFDVRVNGGATPVVKVDSSGAVTSSSSTLTAAGSGVPFALTVSSGVHVLSGKFKLEPGSWIEYADGTVATSTSASSAGSSGSIATVGSTQSFVPSGASLSNSSSFPGCLSGTTVTFTTGNNNVYIWGSGSANPGSTWLVAYAWAILDGQFLGSATASTPNVETEAATSGYPMGFSFSVMKSSASAGTHSLCLGLSANNASGTLVTAYDFGAFEIPSITGFSSSSSSSSAGGSSSSSSAVANSTFTRITAAQSTNSTSWVSVAGGTVTMTANGGRLMLNFACDLTQGSSGGVRAFGGFLLNGQYIDGESATQGFTAAMSNTGPINQIAGQWFHLTESTYTGSVSVVPIFMTGSGGTAMIDENGTRVCQVSVQEIFGTGSNTAGGGSTVLSSSQTVVANTSFSNTSLGPCISTVTMTTGGNKVLVFFNGSAYNSVGASGSWWSYLIDGAPPAGQLDGVSTGLDAPSGYYREVSITAITPTLSAGAHSFCLAPYVGSGTGVLGSSSGMLPFFGAIEYPGTTGVSVSLASTQTFSGAQTFTSSATVGLQVYGSTLSATAPLVGGWSLVGYSTFTAASKVYFYGFQSSTTYRVHFNFLQAASGTPWVVINDLSNSQSFQGYCTDSAGTGYTMSGQNAAGVNLTDQSVGSNGNSTYAVNGEFTIEGSAGQARLTGYGRTEYPINNAANMAGCFYSFTTMTAIPFPFNIKLQPQTSATGRMWVEQFTVKQSF